MTARPEPTVTRDPTDTGVDADASRQPPSPLAAGSVGAVGFRNFRRYTYWSIVSAVLVLLLLPALTGPIPRPPETLGNLSLAAVSIVAIAIVRLIGHHIPPTPGSAPLNQRQWNVWAIIGSVASVLLAGVWLVADDRLLWAFGPAMVVSLLIAELPQRPRRAAIFITVVAMAAIGGMVEVLLDVQPPSATALLAAAVTGFAISLTLATIWSWQVVVQLNEARQTAATLAVANERLRFAADLHDIQGHNLQVIALKSELAGRLLPEDPEAAAAELVTIRELAADALQDTRAVVQGYRRATLTAEITNARTVLGSAGIETHLRIDPDLGEEELSEPTRHVLGLVVREAVTNVLRHSSATFAEVELNHHEGIELRFTNDGADDPAFERAASRELSHGEPGPAHRSNDRGGLDDLADRLRAAGGTLLWRRRGDRFEVQARLPAATVEGGR